MKPGSCVTYQWPTRNTLFFIILPESQFQKFCSTEVTTIFRQCDTLVVCKRPYSFTILSQFKTRSSPKTYFFFLQSTQQEILIPPIPKAPKVVECLNSTVSSFWQTCQLLRKYLWLHNLIITTFIFWGGGSSSPPSCTDDFSCAI